MGATRGASRGLAGVPNGGQRGADGARRGGRWKDYLLLKEKMTCHVNHRQHPTYPTPGGCKENLQ
jgi:hypothetical protein